MGEQSQLEINRTVWNGLAMTYRVTNNNCIFKFSKKNTSALSVPSGSTVEFETLDCYSNQFKSENDNLESIDMQRVNPATGPVFVEGAEPGDTLKVTIEKIEVAEQGIMAVCEGEGTLGHMYKGKRGRLFQIKGDRCIFDPALSIPLRPMVGVIGVAPCEEINTLTPGEHGGNMDNTMIAEGAAVYFPVFVKGALFALGDVHAVMGDGEVGVSGLEVNALVRVRLEVDKNMKLKNPLLENSEFFSTIASAKTIDDAVVRTTEDMAALIMKRTNFEITDLAMLMSAVGSAQICQVVDPLKTARFLMPKWVLSSYGIFTL